MGLSLPDHWLWDFWIADDGTAYHLFFRKAPRVGDPDLRHWNTSVGHAISTDLAQWQVVADALTPSAEPAFDDLATWTGSVVRGDDGTWYLFYTGLSKADDGLVQRVGLATSENLTTWRKHGSDLLVTADSRWSQRWTAREHLRHGVTRGSSVTPLATGGTCSSPRRPATVRPVSGACWAMPGQRIC